MAGLQRCVDAAADQPLLGSAPTLHWLVVVDLARPWVAKVQEQLPLSPAWREQLGDWSRCGQNAGLLARQPEPDAEPRLWVLRGQPGWCEEWSAPLAAADDLLLDNALSAAGRVAPFRLLVCTHGSRDSCCGTLGVPLARSLAPHATVWEVSHLGGHRFAPTLLALPSWRCYGRLPEDAEALHEWLAAVRQAAPAARDFLRGHCGYGARLQVLEAELFLKRGVWPRALQFEDDQVLVDWPDGSRERWEASWVARSHHGQQSCKDFATGKTGDYTSFWLDTAVSRGTVL